MLNLLRFKPDGGRERYLQYINMVGPLVERHGADILYAGDGEKALAAEAGQQWDAVPLVRYRTRRAFAEMIAEPDTTPRSPPHVSLVASGIAACPRHVLGTLPQGHAEQRPERKHDWSCLRSSAVSLES